MKKITFKGVFLLILLFSGTLIMKAQTVLINENFDASSIAAPPGWIDTVLPVPSVPSFAWRFNNPCNFFNAPGGVSPGTTAMSGNVAAEISEGCQPPFPSFDQENDASLITPEFNASSAQATYVLEFDNAIRHTFQNMLCQVDVWNGSVWTPVFTRLATDDGAFVANHKRIDITSACGGSSASKVRFHYVGNGDLFWLIDNVKVTQMNCILPTATFQVVPVCDSGYYHITANVTNMGSTSSLSYGDANNVFTSAITAPGVYTSTGITSGISDVVALINNYDSTCQLVSDEIIYNCPIANDECEDALPLPAPGTVCNNTAGSMQFSTVSAVAPATCQYTNNNFGDVWFKFVATSTAHLIGFSNLSVPNYPANQSVGAIGAAVYSGTCGNLTELSCHLGYFSPSSYINPTQLPSLSISGVNIGDTCYVRVWNAGLFDASSFSPIYPSAFYTFNICVTIPTTVPGCVQGNTPLNNSINGNNVPLFSWNPDYTASGYNIYLGQTNPPTTLYATTGVSSSYQSTAGLPVGDYYWYVQPFNNAGASVGCDVNTNKFTVVEPLVNDEAPGAIEITVDAACNGNEFTNVNGTQSAEEPYPTCVDGGDGGGKSTVWYKFVAPASGAVRVTTDFPSQPGSIPNTRIALFSATDPNSYSTFKIIACDDDNGVNQYMSTMYASNLTPGETYYVAVDAVGTYDTDDQSTGSGTFCLTVNNLVESMLADGDFTTASCVAAKDIPTVYSFGSAANYTGWVSLVDENGRLIAQVMNPDGDFPAHNSAAFYISPGAVRTDPLGDLYLNRNFKITNNDLGAQPDPVLVKLYFKTDELNALNVASNGVTTLNTLKVAKQSGDDCAPQINTNIGPLTDLQQSLNGTVNGVSWIQVATNSFSNFYIKGGGVPLAIALNDITAKNSGITNEVDWTSLHEEDGLQYTLERSFDGNIFKQLANITAKLKPSDYKFIDHSPKEGVNFYRLKMTDKKGSATYSKVVFATVNGKGDAYLNIFPNPANNILNIQVLNAENGSVTISDVSGRTLYSSTMQGTSLQIDISKFSNGIYLVHYVDKNLNRVIKVNKQ